MKNLFKNLYNKFNSESPELIDNTLENFLNDAELKNIDCSGYDSTKLEIEKTNDPQLKHELKVKFKRQIEEKIISYNIKNDDEGNLVDAW